MPRLSASTKRAVVRSRRSGWFWPGVIIALTVAVAVVVVWQVEESRRSSSIRPGATVSGVDIGGLEPEEAVEALETVQADLDSTVVELRLGDQSITVTAEELGITLDTDEVISQADEPPPAVVRPAAWLYDLFASREVDVVVTADIERLEGAMTPYVDPETPRIVLVDGVFMPLAVTEVPDPDMAALATLLETSIVEAVGGSITVDVPTRGMVPADPAAFELAVALATHANEITEGGVIVRLQGTIEQAVIDEQHLRNHILLEGLGRDAHITLHPAIHNTIESVLAGFGRNGEVATITLDAEGTASISGGEPGFRCCEAHASDVLLQGMLNGSEEIVMPAQIVPHPKGREWAQSLGITELVSEFTTYFTAGQQRVKNIALIAEMTQGVIIERGERFSVNDYIGKRTSEKGFVPAGMILNGVFVQSVGGGISQYATTLFNAAFFAGLDFIEYQSHTIYLSRYPYGREATVSYPIPDLVLENNTPHAVMLWPSTTANSITVKIYSTKSVEVQQTDQQTRTIGTSCTHVTTKRTRTWLADNRRQTDSFYAQYRPEGLLCDGSPSVSTTTTVPEDTSPEVDDTDGDPDDTTTDPDDNGESPTDGPDTPDDSDTPNDSETSPDEPSDSPADDPSGSNGDDGDKDSDDSDEGDDGVEPADPDDPPSDEEPSETLPIGDHDTDSQKGPRQPTLSPP